MSINGTFRSVVRPNKITITTDLAGVLGFTSRATSLVINSGQSAPFTSTSNTEHLIVNQIIDITNRSGVDIVISASLMEQGTSIDIEHNTTVALIWTSNGKFYDLGGSSIVKDIEENLTTLTSLFNAHKHTGVTTDKVKATDLDSTGGAIGDFLLLNGGLQPIWSNPFTGTAEAFCQTRNTDITTNLNATNVVVPITGTTDERNTGFFNISGNGIQVVNYSGWIEVEAFVSMTFSSPNISIDFQFAKNGTLQPGSTVCNGVGKFSNTNHAQASLFRGMQVTAGDVITIVSNLEGSTGTATMRNGDSVFCVRIPSSALARGAQGISGNPNWSFLTGFGAPSSGTGVTQDVYLDKTTDDLYRKISSTVWQLEANIKGSQGPAGTSKYMIWGARNGTLTNNTEEWGFGAAGTIAGRGLVQMLPGRITHLGLNLVTAGTGTKTVEIYKNGSATGQSITLAANVGKGTATLASPVTFVAGDLISFRTVLAGAASNGTVTAMCELT